MSTITAVSLAPIRPASVLNSRRTATARAASPVSEITLAVLPAAFSAALTTDAACSRNFCSYDASPPSPATTIVYVAADAGMHTIVNRAVAKRDVLTGAPNVVVTTTRPALARVAPGTRLADSTGPASGAR